MSSAPAAIGRGFLQPVADAQQVFRALLQAMSRPGRIQEIPRTLVDRIDDRGLGGARAAMLLALLDAETSVWLHPRLHEAARVHLGFHTGVRFDTTPAQAAFTVIDAADTADDIWRTLPNGTDSAPQDGATLIIDVPSLARGRTLSLRGPGIATSQRLRVDGLEPGFWRERAAMQAAFPRGIELVLTCGDRLVAIPRSTHVMLED